MYINFGNYVTDLKDGTIELAQVCVLHNSLNNFSNNIPLRLSDMIAVG